MALPERPLSPFMNYRWQYTNTLSILHRASGVFLSLGFLLLVYWVAAAASGSAAYDSATSMLASPLVKLTMFLWLLAFYFHFFNGIRHLGWDLGYGFEKAVARNTGALVFVGAIVLALLTWWCIALRISAPVSGGLV